LVIGRLNVRHLNESTPFIFNAVVVGTNQLNHIALRQRRYQEMEWDAQKALFGLEPDASFLGMPYVPRIEKSGQV
jgi:hypothetical protein